MKQLVLLKMQQVLNGLFKAEYQEINETVLLEIHIMLHG